MAPFTWTPPHHRVTFSFSLHVSEPTRNQEIVPPGHHHSLPFDTPSNRATCHTHAATVSLWNLVRHLVRHRDTTVPPGVPPWNHRTTVPPGAPPCHLVRHRAAVPPPYRHDTSAYLRTPTHLTTVNHTSEPPDTIWRNFTIWSVAKIAMITLLCFRRRTIRFPINIS